MIDIALTQDDDDGDGVIAHRPDCPVVQDHRNRDRPICTLFGVEKGSFADMTIKRHSCLVDQ